jgi:hypothetical protein
MRACAWEPNQSKDTSKSKGSRSKETVLARQFRAGLARFKGVQG